MIKLDVIGFGVTLGCVWGFVVFTLSLASRRSPKALEIVRLISKVYRGFGNSSPGSMIGALWGFVDGALSGLLIAWLYNTIIF